MYPPYDLILGGPGGGFCGPGVGFGGPGGGFSDNRSSGMPLLLYTKTKKRHPRDYKKPEPGPKPEPEQPQTQPKKAAAAGSFMPVFAGLLAVGLFILTKGGGGPMA